MTIKTYIEKKGFRPSLGPGKVGLWLETRRGSPEVLLFYDPNPFNAIPEILTVRRRPAGHRVRE
jgi:hypothetical protein